MGKYLAPEVCAVSFSSEIPVANNGECVSRKRNVFGLIWLNFPYFLKALPAPVIVLAVKRLVLSLILL